MVVPSAITRKAPLSKGFDFDKRWAEIAHPVLSAEEISSGINQNQPRGRASHRCFWICRVYITYDIIGRVTFFFHISVHVTELCRWSVLNATTRSMPWIGYTPPGLHDVFLGELQNLSQHEFSSKRAKNTISVLTATTQTWMTFQMKHLVPKLSPTKAVGTAMRQVQV